MALTRTMWKSQKPDAESQIPNPNIQSHNPNSTISLVLSDWALGFGIWALGFGIWVLTLGSLRFLHPGRLALQAAQVVQLRAADARRAHHVDLRDRRRVQRE